MATVDTSIYSGNPLRSVQDYQALNDQNQIRKQTIQQNALVFQDRQRGLDESTALRNALASGVDPRTPEGRAQLIQVAPNAAGPVMKALGDAEHVAAQTGHENAAAGGLNFDLRVKKADQAIKDISNLQSPDEAAASIFAHHKAGDIDDTKAAALIRGLPQDASQFGQWKNQMLMGIMSAKEKLTMTQPDYKFENTGGAMTPVQTNSYAGPVGTTQAMPAIPITESANNVANNLRVAKEGAANRANQVQIEREKGATSLKVAGVGEDGSTNMLSPEAKAAAAARYRVDGTLPANLGRGVQGVRQTADILNEAARQSAEAGDTPESQRIAQLANKSNAIALNKLQSQQTMVGAFEKNFQKNADMVEGLMAKVDNTGTPLINKWINAGKRSVAGDPNISALDANIKATVNEYAKIVGGGTGSGATAQKEITKIEGLLNAAQAPEQIKAVMDVMRQETANRMSAFEDEKSQLKQIMLPSSKPKTEPSKPASQTDRPPLSSFVK